MLDLFELARLFSNWLKARGGYTCDVTPRYDKVGQVKKFSVDIYRVDLQGNKELLKTIDTCGRNEENMWDAIYDKMFAYFMEVGKYVE